MEWTASETLNSTIPDSLKVLFVIQLYHIILLVVFLPPYCILNVVHILIVKSVKFQGKLVALTLY